MGIEIELERLALRKIQEVKRRKRAEEG